MVVRGKQSVSVVIPTRNEEVNIPILLKRLSKYDYKAIVVDDSDDNTAAIALSLGAEIVKGQRKGLGQAIIDGIHASNADIVVVMDADLSHDPDYIPDLIKPITENGYDMTVGSRYVKGGGVIGWGLKRKFISRFFGLCVFPLTFINDNTSGFFAVRKSIVEGVCLKATSWKAMVEVLIKCKPIAIKEIPIIFKDRECGNSKFNSKEIITTAKHMIKLYLYKYQAIIKFGFVGISGAILHFFVLYALTDIAHLWYIFSAILSIILASTSNYILNHKFSFNERKINNHTVGWIKYQVLSGVTDGIYLGLLALFVEVCGLWYMAGAIIAAILVFPIKYWVASNMIWNKKLDQTKADYEWVSYFKGGLVQKWWKRSIAETVWSWIPKTRKILDVGCGSSPIISYYGKAATGIDLNNDKIKFMRKKLPECRFHHVSIDKVYGKYDNVICIEVLEHLEDAEAVVAKIANLTRPNGCVILATPDYSRALWHIAEFFTPYKEEHITHFTRKSLEDMCAKHKLYPVRYKYIATCDLVELFVKL